MFAVNAWRNDFLEVPGHYGRHRFWRNTSVSQLRPGETKVVPVPGLLGHEWDEDVDNGFRPPGLMHLSSTTVDDVQYLMDEGATFDTGTATHHLTLYRLLAGFGSVFAGWICWSPSHATLLLSLVVVVVVVVVVLGAAAAVVFLCGAVIVGLLDSPVVKANRRVEPWSSGLVPLLDFSCCFFVVACFVVICGCCCFCCFDSDFILSPKCIEGTVQWTWGLDGHLVAASLIFYLCAICFWFVLSVLIVVVVVLLLFFLLLLLFIFIFCFSYLIFILLILSPRCIKCHHVVVLVVVIFMFFCIKGHHDGAPGGLQLSRAASCCCCCCC
ncbi:unnamed protein product [Polarella glacialis]|uniref:N,N-dimethylformamidase beta subunit-like C-terminal domain-containing protein n=1 Tax=Polarella glacialis TaxID=89957 RepID=A0A813LPW4_POLGL|nr:unnamed protein product [Polarella glacialis]